ncbi:hypothetical protein EJB05_27193, partial [Eragrostis curvula]
MASGLVSSLLSSASRLLDLLRRPPAAASGAPRSETADLQRLERLLRRVQATLDDAGEREVRDSSVKLWIEELSDLARDAEDVLDDFRYELLRRRAQERQGSAASTSRKRKHDEEEDAGISQRIGYITRQFEEISRDRAALQLSPEDGKRISERDSKWESRDTSHLLDESLVFGRSEEKECIIKSLLCCSQGSGIHVLPIVGMGGIGKTTVAQLVYNDGRVQESFDLMGWVHVSEKFDLRRLTIEITDSLTRKPCGFNALSSVHDVLKEGVNAKSVFLVLDDLWNEWQFCWQDLLRPLKFARNVTILVTTRSKEVTRLVQTVEPLVLGSLPEDYCWLLFQHYAFGDRIIDEESSLVKVGKKIMNKCGGLPLAIKSIGSLLRSKMDMQTWMEISESEFWEYSDDKEEIFSALRLSFYRLPARLKPCFLLCTLCPKGRRFTKDDMIHLWIAHGYVHPIRYKTLEEVAGQYFDELNGRSLIETELDLNNCGNYLRKQLTKSSVEISSDNLLSTGQKFDELHVRSLVETFRRKTESSSDQSLFSSQWFRLHDMTWDLAKSLSSHSVMATAADDGSFDMSKKDRHLFVSSHDGRFMVNYRWDQLRTFVLKCCKSYNIATDKFTYLRALVLDSSVVFGCISGLRNLCSLGSLYIARCAKLTVFCKEKLPCKPHHVLIDDCPGLMEWCFEQKLYYQVPKMVEVSVIKRARQHGSDYFQSCEHLYLDVCPEKGPELILSPNNWLSSELRLLKFGSKRSGGVASFHGDLCMLRRLEIRDCPKLAALMNLEELDVLHSLVIADCPLLYTLPEMKFPPMLSSLTVQGCHSILSFHLNLPDPSQLIELEVSDCQGLVYIGGVECLSNLESLLLLHCPLLQLQEWLPVIPEYVTIFLCPKLKKWCQIQSIEYQENLPDSSDCTL